MRRPPYPQLASLLVLLGCGDGVSQDVSQGPLPQDIAPDISNPAPATPSLTWQTPVARGQDVLVLANLDDDARRCDPNAPDEALAACFDAADELVNGPKDLRDMAALNLQVQGASEGAAVRVRPTGVGARHARLFFGRGGGWQVHDPDQAFRAERAPSAWRLEMKSLPDGGRWDGTIELEGALLDANGDVIAHDAFTARVAPLIVTHALDPLVQTQVWSRGPRDGLATRLPGDVARWDSGDDRWTQDLFEHGYMSVPSPDGPHIMRVALRAASLEPLEVGQRLRPGGRVVYTHFHGPDQAALTFYDPRHAATSEPLQPFGNLEVVPPHPGAPHGRIVHGVTPEDEADALALLRAQGVQRPIAIDTSWLLVSHIDETVTFAPTGEGWTALWAAPGQALGLLEAWSARGDGQAQMFEDMSLWEAPGLTSSAQRSIAETLEDPEVIAATTRAAASIAEQQVSLERVIGPMNEARLPVLFDSVAGRALAMQPTPVNALVAGDTLVMGHMHGPRFADGDGFERAVEAELRALDLRASWVEIWEEYHQLGGQVHCATNALRAPANPEWWR